MNSRRLLRLFVLLVLSSAALGAIARAEEKPPWSITPAPRKAARWQKRHAEKNELAKKGNVDLLFIGDSITHGWEYGGKKVWKKYYAQRNALNLGFGGDGFEQVLWRLDNGNIDGIHPKLAVVMIGTNNSRSPAGKIAKGIELILDKLKEKLPKTKVLLLAIFPRADHPDMQENLVEVNKLISKFDDGKRVFYLDIGEKFLNSDGRLGREIMPDLLHLNAKGYEIWAEAIEPSVKKLMGEEEPQTRNVRQRPFIVARADRPACVLVCSTNSELRRRAARAVADGARDICGVSLPLNTAKLPPSVSWILVETVEKDGLDDAAIAEAIAVAGREKAPPAGFALRRLERAVAMLADEESAAYQGSVHLRDVLLNRQGNDAVIEDFPALASPFAVRGLYHLTCWGRSPEYRLKDWKVVFDSMAEDGINADYFWMSGLFRSQKCPQAFTYPAHAPSTKEIRRLIDYAHSLGIEFYLGSGVFAWFGIDALAEAHPETKAVGSTGGMCPSNPLARKLNLDYLTEMHDAFPAADGLFLEIRDEYGDCKCPRCAESVPQGGTRYAQSELSFFAELKDAVWKNHPRTKFLWCIGYSDNVHAADKAYYEQLTGEFNDPRFQWLEVRNNWRLPAADGRMRPLRWFSPNMISWSKPYCLSPDAVRSWLKKSEDERMLGAAAAFEPGFHSASYYSGEVPFPVDAIPYAISRFAFRTYSWEPNLSPSVFRERLRRKYFTPEISPELVDDMLWLYGFIQTSSSVAADRTERGLVAKNLSALEKTDPAALSAETKASRAGWLRKVTALRAEAIPRLKEIESRLAGQQPASARSKRGLAMIRRAVDDIRAELLLTPEGQSRLRAAEERLF